jgi:hypothetical protein
MYPSPPSSSVFSSNIIPIILFSHNQHINGKKHSTVLHALFSMLFIQWIFLQSTLYSSKCTNQKAIKPITNHISHYIPTNAFQHQRATFTVFTKN